MQESIDQSRYLESQHQKPIELPQNQAHFFENCSKYISLKRFNQLNQPEMVSQNQSNNSHEQLQSNNKAFIKKWFQSLTLMEKSIVTTVIDKPLVDLIYSMFVAEAEDDSYGKFSSARPYCADGAEAEKYKSIKDKTNGKLYDVIYEMEQKNSSLASIQSNHIRKNKQAEHELINNVRIISVFQENDALALDIDILGNSDYFNSIIKMVDDNFLQREMKMTKEHTIIGSVLLKDSPWASENESQQAGNNQHSKSSGPSNSKDKPYFLIKDPSRTRKYYKRPTIKDQCAQFAAQTSHMYQKLAEREEKRELRDNAQPYEQMTLAQCLSLIIEKAINVQFLESQNKIPIQQHGFFFEKQENNLFTQDLKLSSYWLNLSREDKNEAFKQLEILREEVQMEEKQKKEHCSKIQEEPCEGETSQCSEESFFAEKNQEEKTIVMQLPTEHDQYETPCQHEIQVKKRRSRKDRKRGPNGEKTGTTSSSQSYKTYDYSQKQIQSMYNIDNEKDSIDEVASQASSTMDPETLRPYNWKTNTGGNDHNNSANTAALMMEQQQAVNHLFAADKPENIEFKSRINMQAKGLAVDSEEKSLEFIKAFSQCQSLEKKWLQDTQGITMRRFYDYLAKKQEQFVIDELLSDQKDTKNSTPQKQSKKTKKKNNQQQQQQQEALLKQQQQEQEQAQQQEPPKPTYRDACTTTSGEPTATADQTTKQKKKRKKNKKKKKNKGDNDAESKNNNEDKPEQQATAAPQINFKVDMKRVESMTGSTKQSQFSKSQNQQIANNLEDDDGENSQLDDYYEDQKQQNDAQLSPRLPSMVNDVDPGFVNNWIQQNRDAESSIQSTPNSFDSEGHKKYIVEKLTRVEDKQSDQLQSLMERLQAVENQEKQLNKQERKFNGLSALNDHDSDDDDEDAFSFSPMKSRLLQDHLISQKSKEERTSLLTGEYLHDKYQEELADDFVELKQGRDWQDMGDSQPNIRDEEQRNALNYQKRCQLDFAMKQQYSLNNVGNYSDAASDNEEDEAEREVQKRLTIRNKISAENSVMPVQQLLRQFKNEKEKEESEDLSLLHSSLMASQSQLQYSRRLNRVPITSTLGLEQSGGGAATDDASTVKKSDNPEENQAQQTTTKKKRKNKKKKKKNNQEQKKDEEVKEEEQKQSEPKILKSIISQEQSTLVNDDQTIDEIEVDEDEEDKKIDSILKKANINNFFKESVDPSSQSQISTTVIEKPVDADTTEQDEATEYSKQMTQKIFEKLLTSYQEENNPNQQEQQQKDDISQQEDNSLQVNNQTPVTTTQFETKKSKKAKKQAAKEAAAAAASQSQSNLTGTSTQQTTLSKKQKKKIAQQQNQAEIEQQPVPEPVQQPVAQPEYKLKLKQHVLLSKEDQKAMRASDRFNKSDKTAVKIPSLRVPSQSSNGKKDAEPVQQQHHHQTNREHEKTLMDLQEIFPMNSARVNEPSSQEQKQQTTSTMTAIINNSTTEDDFGSLDGEGGTTSQKQQQNKKKVEIVPEAVQQPKESTTVTTQAKETTQAVAQQQEGGGKKKKGNQTKQQTQAQQLSNVNQQKTNNNNNLQKKKQTEVAAAVTEQKEKHQQITLEQTKEKQKSPTANQKDKPLFNQTTTKATKQQTSQNPKQQTSIQANSSKDLVSSSVQLNENSKQTKEKSYKIQQSTTETAYNNPLSQQKLQKPKEDIKKKHTNQSTGLTSTTTTGTSSSSTPSFAQQNFKSYDSMFQTIYEQNIKQSDQSKKFIEKTKSPCDTAVASSSGNNNDQNKSAIGKNQQQTTKKGNNFENSTSTSNQQQYQVKKQTSTASNNKSGVNQKSQQQLDKAQTLSNAFIPMNKQDFKSGQNMQDTPFSNKREHGISVNPAQLQDAMANKRNNNQQHQQQPQVNMMFAPLPAPTHYGIPQQQQQLFQQAFKRGEYQSHSVQYEEQKQQQQYHVPPVQGRNQNTIRHAGVQFSNSQVKAYTNTSTTQATNNQAAQSTTTTTMTATNQQRIPQTQQSPPPPSQSPGQRSNQNNNQPANISVHINASQNVNYQVSMHPQQQLPQIPAPQFLNPTQIQQIPAPNAAQHLMTQPNWQAQMHPHGQMAPAQMMQAPQGYFPMPGTAFNPNSNLFVAPQQQQQQWRLHQQNLQQQMNQGNIQQQQNPSQSTAAVSTASASPISSQQSVMSPQPTNMFMQQQPQAAPMQLHHPLFHQQPLMTNPQNQQFQQPFQPFAPVQQQQQQQQCSFFEVEALADPAIEAKYCDLLSTQIKAMQSKIEDRLARVKTLREKAYDLIKKTTRETYDDREKLEFEIYGSMATGLAIDTSDMDIAVYGVIDTQTLLMSGQPREVIVSHMNKLHKNLGNLECIQANSLIGTATVPVIKLVISFKKLKEFLIRTEGTCQINDIDIDENDVDTIKLLKIDIIFNDILSFSNSLDMPSEIVDKDQKTVANISKKCAEYISQKTKEHPFLKPLGIVLKKYMAVKDLNSPFQGTMSSYGLVLMIIAVLNDLSKVIDNLESDDQVNLGRAFIHFFNVYGEWFSPLTHGIDEHNQFQTAQPLLETLAEHNANVFARNPADPTALQSLPNLTLIDPVNLRNNVGKQTYSFDQVQTQLRLTHFLIQHSLKDFQHTEFEVIPPLNAALEKWQNQVQEMTATKNRPIDYVQSQIKSTEQQIVQIIQDNDRILEKVIKVDLKTLEPIVDMQDSAKYNDNLKPALDLLGMFMNTQNFSQKQNYGGPQLQMPIYNPMDIPHMNIAPPQQFQRMQTQQMMPTPVIPRYQTAPMQQQSFSAHNSPSPNSFVFGNSQSQQQFAQSAQKNQKQQDSASKE